MIVQQLAALSRNSKKTSKVVSGAIKLQTVLSSFGNASLPSNTHSTRFGLYSEFQYSKSGRMVGIKTLDYLLDKNRITCGHSMDGERNFNIFYQLLAGKFYSFIHFKLFVKDYPLKKENLSFYQLKHPVHTCT